MGFKTAKLKVMSSSMKLDWNTPDHVYEQLDKEFHFSLDPCATPGSAKCKNYFTPEQDGLKQRWFGRVFMNPPYGREIGKWLRKAYYECKVWGNCELVVCLIPSRTDTKWWHNYVMKADEIRFVIGRIKFDGKNPAPFPSAVAIFKRKGKRSGKSSGRK